MVTANELKEWSNDIFPILVDATIAAKNLRLIETEKENGLHVIKHGSFKNLWYQQRFILMVQLAKLFSKSKNQKRNLNKLCNRLENEPFDDEILELIKKNKSKITRVFRSKEELFDAVANFRIRFDDLKTTIENLEIFRDKVFAHTDPINFKPRISLDELEKLTFLACEMHNSLMGKIFDRNLDIRTEELDLRFIIKKLTG